MENQRTKNKKGLSDLTIALICPLNKFLPFAVRGFFADRGLVLLVNEKKYGGENMILSIVKLDGLAWSHSHTLSMKDDYNEENRETWK